MRKEWMEPVIKVQEFVANEYVAACESGMVYKFECNAPSRRCCTIILRAMVRLMEPTNGSWNEQDF